jgi:hypothetical protein
MMFYILLSVLLFASLVVFWRQQNDIARRMAAQKNVSREELVPRHYKSFTEVERQLWAAVQEHKLGSDLERVRFKVREPEFQIIRDYVRGVRDDFKRGHRIWGQIIIRCPEGKLLAQLEWQRIKATFEREGHGDFVDSILRQS